MLLFIGEICCIVNQPLSNLHEIREGYSNGGQKPENPQQPSQTPDREEPSSQLLKNFF